MKIKNNLSKLFTGTLAIMIFAFISTGIAYAGGSGQQAPQQQQPSPQQPQKNLMTIARFTVPRWNC